MTILNMNVPNRQTLKNMKQKLVGLAGETDASIITAGTPISLLATNRTAREKASKVRDLKNTIGQ